MRRYEPECEGETLFLVAADDRVEVGEVDDIVAAVGSDTYTIEYDEKQRTQPWLDTDDGVLDIDVRESVTTITHTGEFVSGIREYDMTTERYGLPRRTVEFADRFVDVLERQGTNDSGS
ncbi:hypothetical protein [Halococcus hamelinensis]|uniref:Uncharacterized protein n=1 Tax=Halococcus hamelinensis 100A6 TaxID=1132509 RepID=M0LUQ0_9EURY|nr:hypothetical protein [Halococcus hamelinensis]EMA37297.1 hypothetical protein C447_13037 [Halococcus hamelinensis 100A6]